MSYPNFTPSLPALSHMTSLPLPNFLFPVLCRPQFLVLTGPPSSRPDMSHFFSHISREIGVMVCGQVLLVSSCSRDCHMTSVSVTRVSMVQVGTYSKHIAYSRKSGSGKKRWAHTVFLNKLVMVLSFEQVKAFHNIVSARTLREGCQNLLQVEFSRHSWKTLILCSAVCVHSCLVWGRSGPTPWWWGSRGTGPNALMRKWRNMWPYSSE